MASKIDFIHLTLCGPSDVQQEMTIARNAINEWNTTHGDALGTWIKHQHWTTDAYPDAKERGQAVINRHLIDSADILICVFWGRFGSPTGVADSGTEEEIRRGIAAKKHVAIYFSDIDLPLTVSDTNQTRRLNSFRSEMRDCSLAWSFRSRTEFERVFPVHLAKIVHEWRAKMATKKSRKAKGSSQAENIVQQNIDGGTGHTQVGGDLHVHQYAKPPRVKVVLERRPNSITPAQAKQIHEWIESLAEATPGKTRKAAFGEWWTRFKKKFRITTYESLPADDFPEARDWYLKNRAILNNKLKRKAPDSWRNGKIVGIKKAMREMGRAKEDYYSELAARLRIPSFASLNDLTKVDLDRVYQRVLADRRNGR